MSSASPDHSHQQQQQEHPTPGSGEPTTPTALGHEFAVPQPMPQHRRYRTQSQLDRAHREPLMHGRVASFCRHKGHGFIVPNGGQPADAIFLHISDIDEEYVPVPGDEVEFKKVPVPPKNEKYMAVHVRIVHLAPDVTHHKWSEPDQ